ncbi:2-oxo acid dehydrogenase subunit E2 [Microbispora sp. NPDC049125]|uniref:2-oxo acid dehydrogenase subunit E2 n=1 Tax=Microbispora sp. NPDC049125 TaxID=3154929 RepID=UPI0034669740
MSQVNVTPAVVLPPAREAMSWLHTQMVPASVHAPIDAGALEDAAAELSSDGRPITPFQAFANLTARALAEHPSVRQRRANRGELRLQSWVNLGVAVPAAKGDFTVEVLPDVDLLDLSDLSEHCLAAIESALPGSPPNSVPAILSHLGGHSVLHGVPVVVAHSVATFFLGAVERLGARWVRPVVVAYDLAVLDTREAVAFLTAIQDAIMRLTVA